MIENYVLISVSVLGKTHRHNLLPLEVSAERCVLEPIIHVPRLHVLRIFRMFSKMAGVADVDSGANRGQLRDTRKALFRSPDQDENNKTPGDNKLMLPLHSQHFYSFEKTETFKYYQRVNY